MKSTDWGTRAYLESLHRQSGKGVPQRNDAEFDKALEFRRREKQHYAAMMQENEKLRHLLQQATRDHDRLLSDSSEVMSAWGKARSKIKELEEKQLSKSVTQHVVASSSGQHSSSVDVLPTNPSGDERTTPRDGGEGRGTGCADEVPGEVLPTDVPDSRGKASEHGNERRQHSEGSV